jgi:hypothetical protein
MPHVTPATTLSRIQNLENQLNTWQYPMNFSGNFVTAFDAAGSSFGATYDGAGGGSTPPTGPGSAAPTSYAYYNFTSDGGVHFAVAVTSTGTTLGLGQWHTMLGTDLPFAPPTNKFFSIYCDLPYQPSSGAPVGLGGCFDVSGNLHVAGFGTEWSIIAFDVTLSLLY